jgi:hypothetical protein
LRLFQFLCYGSFVLSYVQAQPISNYELSIEERLAAYCQLNNQEKFEESLAYLYPPLFEVMDREVLLEQLRYNAHHPDLQLIMGNRCATYIANPVESRGDFYAQVTFTQELYATFKPDAAEDLSFIEATLEMFSNEFGVENLSYEPAIHQIMIKIPKRYLAIRTDAELEWFFLELAPSTLPFLEGLLPPRVRSYLK